MKIIYKILFEVKLLHEYYLTDPNFLSVFTSKKGATQTQQDRIDFLEARLQNDQPSVDNDIQFVLPANMTQLFKEQRLLLFNSYSGFQIAVQVTESLQSDGTILYTPSVPLPDDFNFFILMKETGGRFSRLTNGRMQRPIKSLYYFSNENIGDPKTAPVLSRPISAYSSDYVYEQGELSYDGSDINICYYQDAKGTNRVLAKIEGDGFANENDRLITGTEIEYLFDISDTVTNAQFSLKDSSGNNVRTISVHGQKNLGTVMVNFKDPIKPTDPPLVTLPDAKISDPILYTLEVTGNGNYSKTLNLIFYENEVDLLSSWGVIQIQTAVSDNNFHLLDANGNIINIIPQPPATIQHPIFEIRCKSRYSFWRYYCDDQTMTLNAPTGAAATFLQNTAQPLITTSPVSSIYPTYFFSANPKAAVPSYTYLPNPVPDTLIDAESKQFYSNIMVPVSNLFPATPI